VWNEAGTFLDFSVAPAYYQTNWFRLSCVAALAALLWMIYKLRVRSIQQRFGCNWLCLPQRLLRLLPL
jgi:hypothetical protein